MGKADLKLTKHHICPRSKNGTNEPSNIVMIKQHWHRKYHTLFGNKTPHEILDFLEGYFWNGDKTHIKNYKTHTELFKELFDIDDKCKYCGNPKDNGGFFDD